jgi:hypothetical protein
MITPRSTDLPSDCSAGLQTGCRAGLQTRTVYIAVERQP